MYYQIQKKSLQCRHLVIHSMHTEHNKQQAIYAQYLSPQMKKTLLPMRTPQKANYMHSYLITTTTMHMHKQFYLKDIDLAVNFDLMLAMSISPNLQCFRLLIISGLATFPMMDSISSQEVSSLSGHIYTLPAFFIYLRFMSDSSISTIWNH